MTMLQRAPEHQLRFRVLGRLEAWSGSRILPLGGEKKRLVLAVLLINANKPVSADQLIDALWGESPPRSATANLQTYISGLRSCLAEVGAAGRIETVAGGYRISVATFELDLLEFESLVEEARRMHLDNQMDSALELLVSAAALWRGTPLSDLPAVPALAAELEGLAEQLMAATDDRLALHIRLGQYGVALAELRKLLPAAPFRERLWQFLLVALHRSGRRAEALQTYQDLRRRFIDELGVEPGMELRRAHEAILVG